MVEMAARAPAPAPATRRPRGRIACIVEGSSCTPPRCSVRSCLPHRPSWQVSDLAAVVDDRGKGDRMESGALREVVEDLMGRDHRTAADGRMARRSHRGVADGQTAQRDARTAGRDEEAAEGRRSNAARDAGDPFGVARFV